MKEEEIMKKKVEYFYKKKLPVHIKKKSGFINNGLILEYSGDMIILNDIKSGAMPIYFLEILEIEQQREVRQ